MKKLPVFVILLFLFLAYPNKLFAASTLYFSPGSGNLRKGENFNVNIMVNSGQEYVNAVTANFIYPPSQLTINSVTFNESVLPIVAEKTIGGGIVKISGGNYKPFFGDQLLATVNFTVDSDSSAASLVFDDNSVVVRSGDNQNDLNDKRGAKFSLLSVVSNQIGIISKPSFSTVKSEKTVNLVEVLKIFIWNLFGVKV